MVAVRWHLRYGLSYRDVEELLAERGVTVNHVTIYCWVQRFTSEFVEAVMFGLKTFRSARVVAAGHAFVQNLRRGHYEMHAGGVRARVARRVRVECQPMRRAAIPLCTSVALCCSSA